MPGPRMTGELVRVGRSFSREASGTVLRPGDKGYHGRILAQAHGDARREDRIRRNWRQKIEKPWEDSFDESTANQFLALAGGTAAASTVGGLALRAKLRRENEQLRRRRVKKSWHPEDPGMWHAPKKGNVHRITTMGEKGHRRGWRAKLGRAFLEDNTKGSLLAVGGLSAAVAPLVLIPHKEIQENTRLRTGHGRVTKALGPEEIIRMRKLRYNIGARQAGNLQHFRAINAREDFRLRSKAKREAFQRRTWKLQTDKGVLRVSQGGPLNLPKRRSLTAYDQRIIDSQHYGRGISKSARLDALSRLPGLARRNARDAALPAGLLAVGTGGAAVQSRRRHESGRRTTGSTLATLGAGGAGESAWRATGLAIRRKGNALVRTERPGQSKSQRKKAESEWRHRWGISGSSSSEARASLRTNYKAMRDYPKSNAAAPYKRALGQMSGKRGLAMEAAAVGVPMLVARHFTRSHQVQKNGPRDPQKAYESAKAKGYPHDFDTFMSRFGEKNPEHGVKTRVPKAPVKRAFRLPRSWTTSAIGAGLTAGAIHHVVTHPASTPQRRHSNEAYGAAAGAAGANVGYQMGGKATKIGIQAYRNPRMTPEHNRTWQHHLESHGIHSGNQLGGMGFEARRKVYARYPLSIPGGRAQRLLAFKNRRSVGVATSAVGAALGARWAGDRKHTTAKRYDARDVRARKMRRDDKVQLGLGTAEAGAALAGLKGRRAPLRLLFAAPGVAAAGQAAYDLRQDEYGWSPAERARRHGRVQMVGKSREYGYLERKRSIPRTTEMLAGLGLLGYGVPRLKMLGPAAQRGVRLADKHGAGKEARAALQLAQAFGAKTREVTGRGETRLRQIKTLDQAISSVPRSIRGEVATAAGALMAVQAHPTTKNRFEPMGSY